MKNKALQLLMSGLNMKAWRLMCFRTDLSSSPLASSSHVRQMGINLHVVQSDPQLSVSLLCSVEKLHTKKCPERSMDPAELSFIFLSFSICFSLIIFLSPGLISTIIKFSLLHFHFSLPQISCCSQGSLPSHVYKWTPGGKMCNNPLK